MNLFGSYDVVGHRRRLLRYRRGDPRARARAHAMLLLEGTGFLGGLITGGRLTKPTGLINSAIFHEMLDRCVGYRAPTAASANPTGASIPARFDAEVMQRVIIEMVEEAGVEVLLRADGHRDA